jgi:hypothetical protein
LPPQATPKTPGQERPSSQETNGDSQSKSQRNPFRDNANHAQSNLDDLPTCGPEGPLKRIKPFQLGQFTFVKSISQSESRLIVTPIAPRFQGLAKPIAVQPVPS